MPYARQNLQATQPKLLTASEHSHSIHIARREMKTKRHTQKSAISASPEGGEVRIEQATASYEKWMGNCTAVVSSDLRLKHEQMKEPVPVLRALSTGGPSYGRQSAPTCVARLRCSLWETCMSRVLEPGETQRVASVGKLHDGPGERIFVFALCRMVALRAAWLLHHPARMPLTHPMRVTRMAYRTAPSFRA
jgi:hypothetical protein